MRSDILNKVQFRYSLKLTLEKMNSFLSHSTKKLKYLFNIIAIINHLLQIFELIFIFTVTIYIRRNYLSCLQNYSNNSLHW